MSKEKKQSAGLLLFKKSKNLLNILLVHPGGPFWAKKDDGAWSIPKGEFSDEENPFDCAIREFYEETGQNIEGNFSPLTTLKQPSGKIIHAWAIEAEFEVNLLKSNYFEMEWPPKSGKRQQFPEIDRAQWFTVRQALKKILPGQSGFIIQLCEIQNYDYSSEAEIEDPKTQQSQGQLDLF